MRELIRPEPDFQKIVPHFNFSGEFIRAEPIVSEHINDTCIAYFSQADGEIRRYIMQRINHFVFKKPEEVMANILAVTTHLHEKTIASGGNPYRETLTLIPAHDGAMFHCTDKGDYWRAYVFIDNAHTYQIPQNPEHVYNAARAYGCFQQSLSDFPAEQLHETIPDFHNTPKRYEAFVDVLEKDGNNRAHGAIDEINFVLQRADDIPVLVDLVSEKRLPIRVTHNDTNFNNVMIDDKTGEGICVIDLDTVMPGSLLYDFGDAIRSITNTGEEDERDLSLVRFSLGTFDRYTQGYLDTTSESLEPEEIDYLAFSARLMTLESGMRFLTDHITGDIYFRTKRENHNLDRCRTQFRLVKEMEENYAKMSQIIENYL